MAAARACRARLIDSCRNHDTAAIARAQMKSQHSNKDPNAGLTLGLYRAWGCVVRRMCELRFADRRHSECAWALQARGHQYFSTLAQRSAPGGALGRVAVRGECRHVMRGRENCGNRGANSRPPPRPRRRAAGCWSRISCFANMMTACLCSGSGCGCAFRAVPLPGFAASGGDATTSRRAPRGPNSELKPNDIARACCMTCPRQRTDWRAHLPRACAPRIGCGAASRQSAL